MAISSITLAELLHGAEKSSRVSENLSAIEDFCSRLEVLPYGVKAAQHFGAIVLSLLLKSKAFSIAFPPKARLLP